MASHGRLAPDRPWPAALLPDQTKPPRREAGAANRGTATKHRTSEEEQIQARTALIWRTEEGTDRRGHRRIALVRQRPCPPIAHRPRTRCPDGARGGGDRGSRAS
jgi:hypothetical protein